MLLLVASSVAAATLGEQARFAALCDRYGVYRNPALRLGHPPAGGERGLFTIAPVAAGELLLAVPWSLCLVDRDLPGDAPLRTPFEVPGRQSAYDTRLAAALLAARRGSDVGGDDDTDQALRSMLWREWAAEMLPPPGRLSHPLALSDDLLDQLQHPALADAARAHRRRLATLHPDGGTDAGLDAALWAACMVSSRPFRMADAAGVAGAAMLTAFVPFIDMANTRPRPEELNCEVQGRAPADGASEAGGYEAVGLVASRDLLPGEECLIPYFGPSTSASIFFRFGFVGADDNRHDRIGLCDGEGAADLPALNGALLRESVSALRAAWREESEESGAPRAEPSVELLEAALLSLPLTRDEPLSAAAEVEAGHAVLAALREVDSQHSVTSLADDEAALDGGAARGAGARMGTILRYRTGRKRLVALAIEIVEAHLARLTLVAKP